MDIKNVSGTSFFLWIIIDEYLTTGATLAPQLNTELVSWVRAERLEDMF